MFAIMIKTRCINGMRSDWIAVNVLRSVALSTNSVAASVEPMMQQQFFSLSPMAGQESFNTLEVRPQQTMNHTPTTSSMLAALQHDAFPSGSIDPTSSSAFNADAYGTLSYMDTSTSQEDTVSTNQHSGLSFPDYVSGSGNSFDVGAFTPQDLGIPSSTTPAASEPEHDPEPVKSEGAA
jgi:regulatory factor X